RRTEPLFSAALFSYPRPTFVFFGASGRGTRFEIFPKGEAFAVTNELSACLRDLVAIRVTTPLGGLVLASRSTISFVTLFSRMTQRRWGLFRSFYEIRPPAA